MNADKERTSATSFFSFFLKRFKLVVAMAYPQALVTNGRQRTSTPDHFCHQRFVRNQVNLKSNKADQATGGAEKLTKNPKKVCAVINRRLKTGE